MSVNMASKTREPVLWEVIKIVLQAVLIAVVIRTVLFQPFNIPSGSMKKTLLVGDYLFVSKFSYGYSRYSFVIPFTNQSLFPFSGRIFSRDPQRGDVAVFKKPKDNSTDYIKRIIGLPGDKIQMKNGVLFINGKEVPKVRTGQFLSYEEVGPPVTADVYRETLPNGVSYSVLDTDPTGPLDSTMVYEVPADHFFMMGDNRDNSQDSRVLFEVGYVPRENLIGRAQIIFFSVAGDESDPNAFHWYMPWTWLWGIHWGRLFTPVR